MERGLDHFSSWGQFWGFYGPETSPEISGLVSFPHASQRCECVCVKAPTNAVNLGFVMHNGLTEI